jgi:hypothetical protein
LAKQSDNVFDTSSFASRFGKKRMEVAEVKHGQLTMVAATAIFLDRTTTTNIASFGFS